MLQVNIIMLHVEMNKSHVNINLLDVNIMYLAYMEQVCLHRIVITYF